MHAHERARRGGFTLIETMIALTLLGIGLLSLSTMQIVAMKHGNRGRHTTQAAAIAQSRMEVLQRMRWSEPALAPTGGWMVAVPVNNVVQDGGNKLEQAYSRSERITDDVAGVTRTIDVRINWNEPGRPNRQYAISSIRFNFEGL
jgi:prepilin-type N-terminal cleavage/methylation domain-containing protein